jgi:hypothetical protein
MSFLEQKTQLKTQVRSGHINRKDIPILLFNEKATFIVITMDI